MTYNSTHLWSSNVRIASIWLTTSWIKDFFYYVARCCKVFEVGNGILLAAYRLMYFAAPFFIIINANSYYNEFYVIESILTQFILTS